MNYTEWKEYKEFLEAERATEKEKIERSIDEMNESADSFNDHQFLLSGRAIKYGSVGLLLIGALVTRAFLSIGRA